MQLKDIHGHSQVIKNLIEAEQSNRLSHALLFLGMEGIGKISVALAYAQYLNCLSPTEDHDSCGHCKSCKKYNKLVHPDLHFIYPVVRSPKISKPVSLDYIAKWRSYVQQSKYHSYKEWLEYIGTDNLQGNIYAQESLEIIKIINLKTFEGKYKVLLIYMPEMMNIAAANKLLKAIEEPPPDTLFILVSEDEGGLLTTIRSRVQLIKFGKLTDDEMVSALSEEFLETDQQQISDAVKISAGNCVYAKNIINLSGGNNENNYFKNFDLFVNLMRSTYSNNFIGIQAISLELSSLGREKQKTFIEYALNFTRENFIYNEVSGEHSINYLTKKELEFVKKFSPFIHSNNIEKLSNLYNRAYADIMRNASAKILFLDLALKISNCLKINKP